MVDAKELNRLSDKYIKADLDAIHFFEFLEEELLNIATQGYKKLQMSEEELELKLKRFCRIRNYTEITIKDICYNPFYRNYYINELRKRDYIADFDIWDELSIDWSAAI